jgi:hypothetical protein
MVTEYRNVHYSPFFFDVWSCKFPRPMHGVDHRYRVLWREKQRSWLGRANASANVTPHTVIAPAQYFKFSSISCQRTTTNNKHKVALEVSRSQSEREPTSSDSLTKEGRRKMEELTYRLAPRGRDHQRPIQLPCHQKSDLFENPPGTENAEACQIGTGRR